jgi:hypothetical protein
MVCLLWLIDILKFDLFQKVLKIKCVLGDVNIFDCQVQSKLVL